MKSIGKSRGFAIWTNLIPFALSVARALPCVRAWLPSDPMWALATLPLVCRNISI